MWYTAFMGKSIKSKERVADFGEVFTNEREVKAMCDLAKDETERIDSRVLEPACGDGNFLAEILNRKLATVESKYGKNPHEFEKYSVVAISSLYGVDILEDNAKECRERLFGIWEKAYDKKLKAEEINPDCKTAVKFILKHNILYGDALTLLQNDGKPIVFAEWSLITGCFLKRRDFELSTMLEMHDNGNQPDLFLSSDEFDKETNSFIPKPIREFKPIEYWRVQCQNE